MSLTEITKSTGGMMLKVDYGVREEDVARLLPLGSERINTLGR